jgi:hypothetical protein
MPTIRLLTVAVALALSHQLSAQPSAGALSGQATIGIRSVDVDGATKKFREDINLDDGVRLFDASFSYRPDNGSDTFADRVDFRAENLGGDPFESMTLSAAKRGRYAFDMKRTRSEYFYEDTILPAALASVTASTGGDFHHFDFERTRDTADLEIRVSPATTVNVGLERFTRVGESTTTLDLERDEFEIERPIDESLNALAAGVEHRFDKVTVLFEQQSRDFENTNQLFLPGASVGSNTGDLAELSFFSAEQSYDYASRTQLLRLVARPTERLDLIGTWRHEDLELDMTASESVAGTSFNGNPVNRSEDGSATVVRDIDLHTLDAGYSLNERFRIVGTLRQSKLTQQGRLDFAMEPGLGLWMIDTTGTEIGFEAAVGSDIVVGAGVSDETRDTDALHEFEAETHTDLHQTDRTGYFVRLSAGLTDQLDLNASIEDDDIDDPYALAAPSASRRYRIRLRQRWDNGLSLSGILRETTLENQVSGWKGDTQQTDVRLNLERERFSLGAGIGMLDLSRDIAQLVTGGSRQDLFLIDYDADVKSRDVSASWRMNDRVTFGGRIYRYENDGSYPLRQDDERVYADIDLSEQYLVRISLRDIDYREDRFDDYDATVLELGLGLRW